MAVNEVSFRGRKIILPEQNDNKIEKELLKPKVLSVLLNRNISNIEGYLNPTLKNNMPDPYSLINMEILVNKLADIIENDEKITVWGDYDVDGATSTAQFIRYFEMLGKRGIVDYYIPQRIEEGYGPNNEGIKILSDKGNKNILFVDSGTMAHQQIEYAKSLNIVPMILDHHDPKEDGDLPKCIFVNPKQAGHTVHLEYLCTAGLAMMTLISLNRILRERDYFDKNKINEPDLKSLLALVALGTVADMVPLIELNRAFVKQGLKFMEVNPGLKELATVTKTEKYNVRACGFVFGPCINAAGRIDDTTLGTQLLIENDKEKSAILANRLFELNRERQEIQKIAIEEAIQMVEKNPPRGNMIIVQNENWHPGVVGLVASKLKDRFEKSSVVIGSYGKGSARSTNGVDIGFYLHEGVDHGFLLSGGGHKLAGGLTLKEGEFNNFVDFMNNKLQIQENSEVKIDLVTNLSEISIEMVESFNTMEPFGIGNSHPMVLVNEVTLATVNTIGNLKNHIKGKIKNNKEFLDFILFDGANTKVGQYLLDRKNLNTEIEIIGILDINEYKERKTVQLKIEDINIKI
jgi:single-stranded-DNA-specific exonuclease